MSASDYFFFRFHVPPGGELSFLIFASCIDGMDLVFLVLFLDDHHIQM